ncbi:MAG: Sec-independent protein translocase protein TatB [Gammaproteobacteria bacterium]
MFDVGFWELVFIAIITLLVVGPERLPKIARMAGLWLGKMRGFVSSVKQDIDRELAADELKAALEKQAAVPELEEFLDEVSGEPLEAGEHPAPSKAKTKQVSEDESDRGTGVTSDDQAK